VEDSVIRTHWDAKIARSHPVKLFAGVLQVVLALHGTQIVRIVRGVKDNQGLRHREVVHKIDRRRSPGIEMGKKGAVGKRRWRRSGKEIGWGNESRVGHWCETMKKWDEQPKISLNEIPGSQF
jgi:hypothetical protein